MVATSLSLSYYETLSAYIAIQTYNLNRVYHCRSPTFQSLMIERKMNTASKPRVIAVRANATWLPLCTLPTFLKLYYI
jgi:hypothetical protein